MVASFWVPVSGLLLLASFSSAAQFTCNGGPSDVEIDGSTSGEIISPNFPSAYPPNKDCTWKIKAPLAHLVRVTITDLNLAEGDTLTLSDGETAFPGNLIGMYSSCMDGKLSLFSTGSNMVVQFKSNGATEDKGFKLTFKVVRKSKVEVDGKVAKECPSGASIVTGSSGYMAHPEFPNAVSSIRQCDWQISVPSDKELFLSYNMFGLAKKTSFIFCNDNSVRHSMTGSPVSGRYFCACQKPDNLKSSSNSGHVRFVSSTNKAYPGFLSYYKALDPGTCSDPKTCDQLNDDRDVGFDRNGNVLFEKKPVTTAEPPPTTTPAPKKVPPKPFLVNCKRDEIEIVLNITKFPELQHESATLLDYNCKASHTNSTHVFIKTPLDRCGTNHNYSSDGRYIIYHNQILIQKKSKAKSDVITRDHEAAFVFECSYYRSAVMSVVHFTPARARVFTKTENFGNFTFEMKMFENEDYSKEYDKYPALVLANQRIFFQTEVTAKDAELVLLVENCKVTPSTDPNDKEYYVIIEKGCERDETLKYKHKLSPVQRFNFKAFYFESDRDATIHIHCRVRVCRKADRNSRCVKGCPYSKRRRRSDDVDSEDISGTLMIGPLQNSKQEAISGRLSSPESRTMIIEVLIGVLGFIVMMLVAAVVVVVLKRRQPKENLTLMVDDEE